MGFDWSVCVSVEFCQPIQRECVCLKELLEKMVKFKAVSLAPSYLAARECGGRKKMKKGANADRKAANRDQDEESIDLNPSEFAGGRLELVEEIVKCQEQCDDWDLEIAYNRPQFLSRAFKFALTELVGDEVATNFDLIVDIGGAYGEADRGAEEESLRLVFTPATVVPGADLRVGRGGVNAPWGVCLKVIDRMNLDEVAAACGHFKAICEQFDLVPIEAAGWRLVTVASGG